MPASDCWNPTQYNRFRQERAQPFQDLARLIQIQPAMRVIDRGSFYLSRIDESDGHRFLQLYKARWIEAIGPLRPYHSTYRRLLLWARTA